MNHNLKQEILNLCKIQAVREVHPGYRYEIFKDPLSVKMLVKTDGPAITYELSITNTWARQSIYTQSAYISDRFHPVALTPNQIDLRDICDAMINNVQHQRRKSDAVDGNEYQNALNAIAAIKKTFRTDKTK